MGALLSSCFKGNSVVEIGAYRCQFGKQIGEGNYSFVYQGATLVQPNRRAKSTSLPRVQ